MHCSCGVRSTEECQAMQYKIIVKEAESYEYAGVHRLRVDTYCLQHPNIYLVSSKSFFSHLLGLCIALDYNNDPNLFKAIEKWEYGKNQIHKPPMLESFGNLTISHIMNANDGLVYDQLVKEWAKSVWGAYKSYQELAHRWIKKAKEEYYK
jgi:hypothetical protein